VHAVHDLIGSAPCPPGLTTLQGCKVCAALVTRLRRGLAVQLHRRRRDTGGSGCQARSGRRGERDMVAGVAVPRRGEQRSLEDSLVNTEAGFVVQVGLVLFVGCTHAVGEAVSGACSHRGGGELNAPRRHDDTLRGVYRCVWWWWWWCVCVCVRAHEKADKTR
jgi:hypothetical protein